MKMKTEDSIKTISCNTDENNIFFLRNKVEIIKKTDDNNTGYSVTISRSYPGDLCFLKNLWE